MPMILHVIHLIQGFDQNCQFTDLLHTYTDSVLLVLLEKIFFFSDFKVRDFVRQDFELAGFAATGF